MSDSLGRGSPSGGLRQAALPKSTGVTTTNVFVANATHMHLSLAISLGQILAMRYGASSVQNVSRAKQTQ
jgi:hypothetical protein